MPLLAGQRRADCWAAKPERSAVAPAEVQELRQEFRRVVEDASAACSAMEGVVHTVDAGWVDTDGIDREGSKVERQLVLRVVLVVDSQAHHRTGVEPLGHGVAFPVAAVLVPLREVLPEHAVAAADAAVVLMDGERQDQRRLGLPDGVMRM